ncbi:glycoside hydrolase family 2 protein [Paenibacillus sp. sgz302251]|uniref:glycoside hydrolase family 2 protein n=1 Tax=Paenibacillus sp. sgz302251 TaxID=3414493 RepID=UPI003C7BB79B
MNLDLKKNWHILQDVHDTGEHLEIYKDGFDYVAIGHQMSEWEPIDELKHLQVLLSDKPYFGRELRYFNQAPWWYKNEFDIPADGSHHGVLKFTNVDYFCKVWFNGEYIGEHEGYSIPFEFDVSNLIRKGDKNSVIVKVWSPWDKDVHLNDFNRRTFNIKRDLTKGTYEHDDTLIARDVNPVGIYGSVSLELYDGIRFAGAPLVSYELADDLTAATIKVSAEVINQQQAESAVLVCTLINTASNVIVGTFREELDLSAGQSSVTSSFDVDSIQLWNTWDRGAQNLYELHIELVQDDKPLYSAYKRIGFRKVGMIRTEEETTFIVNGKKMYIRGTSYFPEVYISCMHKDRYLRDLQAIKNAGFNLVRVHVHVEQPIFYDLCDEVGIAIMQDSEYNWTHPVDSDWAKRFIEIYEQTVYLLNDHPSVINWICLNEPGVFDNAGRSEGYAMQISPGPQLYDTVTRIDPSRPVIKGSFCDDDLTSGDSHNYTGSLEAPDVHYTAIYGTTEKLNTEYGFDAPGCASNLKTIGPVNKRLANIIDDIDDIQYYQYRLIKYFTEHYRIQKYRPCSGYVHFMFIDLCPQSFYGVYDWWGIPKMGLKALTESNQPLGVFMEQSADKPVGIWFVNDLEQPLGTCSVEWTVTDDSRALVSSGTRTVEVGGDSSSYITDLSFEVDGSKKYRVSLIVKDGNGKTIASNRYEDAFNHPVHVKGHPWRMNHEYGVRVYYV